MKMGAHFYECDDVSSSNISKHKTVYSHHKKMDALHCDWAYVLSYNPGIWKISYIYYTRKDVHCYEFLDAESCCAAIWKISYTHHTKMDAHHCECEDVSAD